MDDGKASRVVSFQKSKQLAGDLTAGQPTPDAPSKTIATLILYMKSRTVRTPIGAFAKHLRWTLDWPQRHKYPELWDVYLEDRRMALTLDKILRPDACCVDVGSHVGSFLNLVLKRCPNGKHVAIEPVPHKAAWLAKRFPEVRVHAVATSDVAGELMFEENVKVSGVSRLKPAMEKSHEASLKYYKVSVMLLDDLLADLSQVDLIKLDVEGNEAAALRGAKQTINKHRPWIIFECGPQTPQAERDAVFETLSGLNYKLSTFADFLFGKEPLSLSEFRKCSIYPFRAFNLIANPG